MTSKTGKKASATNKAVRRQLAIKAVAKTPVKSIVKTIVKATFKTSAKPVAKKATTAKAPTKAPTKAPAKASAKGTIKPSSQAVKTKSKIKLIEPTAAKPPSKVTSNVLLKVTATTASTVPAKSSKAQPKPDKSHLAAIPKPAGKAPGRPSSRPVHQGMMSGADGGAALTVASYSSTMPLNAIDAPLPPSLKRDPKLANNWKTKPGEALSDAELLAMPDSEYMNDKQLAAFRVRLNRLKDDILANAGETTEHLREETVIVPDPADRATIEEEHALELRTRDRERKLLKKIEQSLTRIDSGDFGYCDETGEVIGVGRLLARPTATLSLEAQQRRELKQKMFGD
jgi:DnaK suppressor protein